MTRCFQGVVNSASVAVCFHLYDLEQRHANCPSGR
jgi:hypothetical protein